MQPDVEFLRALLLYLEMRQVSPRSTVVIVLRDEADELDETVATFLDGLNLLLDLDYIEGPGPEGADFWLFRKLTRKGLDFADAARKPSDWNALKRNRAARPISRA